MWHCPTEGTYIVIEDGDRSIICPSEDIEPHNLESADCICKPDAHFTEGILHIVHNRMSDQRAVDAALKNLF